MIDKEFEMVTENKQFKSIPLGRLTGQSTRLIDSYIQELFTCGVIQVQDHYPAMAAHVRLFNRVIGRLELEHPITKLELNKEFLQIKIKDFK